MATKRKVRKRVSAALKKWLATQKKNSGRRNAGGTSTARAARGVTLRNMASVTIKRLPGGAVAVTGRKLNGARRKR